MGSVTGAAAASIPIVSPRTELVGRCFRDPLFALLPEGLALEPVELMFQGIDLFFEGGQLLLEGCAACCSE